MNCPLCGEAAVNAVCAECGADARHPVVCPGCGTPEAVWPRIREYIDLAVRATGERDKAHGDNRRLAREADGHLTKLQRIAERVGQPGVDAEAAVDTAIAAIDAGLAGEPAP